MFKLESLGLRGGEANEVKNSGAFAGEPSYLCGEEPEDVSSPRSPLLNLGVVLQGVCPYVGNPYLDEELIY